eukprot:jgi/Tetstr1/445446/TSEL_033225.t1
MPIFPSVKQVLYNLKRFLADLSIDVGSGTAYLSPALVVRARLKYLWETGRLDLNDGMVLAMQVLGDATQIWKTLKTNGTLVCIKILYEAKEALKGKHKESAQTLEHLRAIVFYLGDDCKAEILAALPRLAADLEELQRDGLEVSKTDKNGNAQTVRVKIHLYLGGDKFIVAMLGLASHSSHYPCMVLALAMTDIHAKHNVPLASSAFAHVNNPVASV